MKKIVAMTTMIMAFVMVLYMYFSATFLPIYVGGEYVVGNQILRYVLYLILISIVMIDFSYIVNAPTKRRRKKRR